MKYKIHWIYNFKNRNYGLVVFEDEEKVSKMVRRTKERISNYLDKKGYEYEIRYDGGDIWFHNFNLPKK